MIRLNSFIHNAIAVACGLLLIVPPTPAEESHIVPRAQLQQQLASQANARRGQEAVLRQFLQAPPVVKAMKSTGIDSARIQQAVSALDDKELSDLAARIAPVNRDLQAGALNNEQITYILIALCTAVIVLILVH